MCINYNQGNYIKKKKNRKYNFVAKNQMNNFE